jgi:predicted regulator of Ras-like GTPase activity (Roadblock/LC7/MglB family)
MSENLTDILSEMSTEITGYAASVVIGMDGLNIANHTVADLNPDTISAQITLLFKLVDNTVEKLGAGVVEDDLLTTEEFYVLMRFLPKKQYFLGIAVNRKKGGLGNLRLFSKLYTERIAKALVR